MLSYIMQPFF